MRPGAAQTLLLVLLTTPNCARSRCGVGLQFKRYRRSTRIGRMLSSPTHGFELIKRIRQSNDATVREIPAAVLTAYARAEDRVKALQSGFHMHLAKPVDPAELIVAVAALTKRTAPRSR